MGSAAVVRGAEPAAAREPPRRAGWRRGAGSPAGAGSSRKTGTKAAGLGVG